MLFIINLLENLLYEADGGGNGGSDGGGNTSSDSQQNSNTDTKTENQSSNNNSDNSNTENNNSKEANSTTKEDKNTKQTKQEHNNIDIANLKQPKYISQLKKEHQELDLSKYETIDDLVDAVMDYEKKSERSIEIPGKDASEEEIRAFLSKMGVPEDSDKYNLQKGNLTDEEYTSLRETFKNEAYKAALSSGQAERIWKMISNHFVAQRNAFTKMQEDAINSFETRFDSYIKENENILDEHARVERMQEDVNYFKKFAIDNGLGNLFAKIGLNLNPEFISKIAKVQKSLNGSFVASNGNTKDNSSTKAQYGEQFVKMFGNPK